MILKSLWYFAYLDFPSFLNCFLKTDVTTLYSCARYQNVGNKLQFTIIKSNYSNLFENSSDFGNNMGQLFFGTASIYIEYTMNRNNEPN